ncbi:4-hydroxybenzoyl-CoA reductase [Kribbella qitaiheensis]|uniref:4-hydroxybenzoyl-CoA reductase n=1 Tax=Kribbella qitaiheensis TaxID=1544730 RepID=A0A7G6WVB1_9ACTN|nr:ABATE domain-containing protein [Kribbella qitaiheensis]QNE17926.1 4-hydroxybenzoyl-CoA reductase [Kribbella qitaiheensis]
MAVDLLEFPFIGGRPALNFVGTLGKRGSEDIERLRTPEDLTRWGIESGLSKAASATATSVELTASAVELQDARLLREALYGLTMATLGRAPARSTDVALVNEWAAHETHAPALVLRSGALHRDEPESTAAAVLAAVARDGIDLLTGPEAASIRDCEDPTCTLLFVDTSRSHRRRWCSMARCGARAKMRTLRSPG